MHAMSTLQNRGSLAEQLLLEEEEDRHGQALQCSLFSSFAIGGLLLGYPVSDVSRYIESARLCRERIRGVADPSAVSALILYANAHAFVGTRESREEYRSAMSEADAVSQVGMLWVCFAFVLTFSCLFVFFVTLRLARTYKHVIERSPTIIMQNKAHFYKPGWPVVAKLSEAEQSQTDPKKKTTPRRRRKVGHASHQVE